MALTQDLPRADQARPAAQAAAGPRALLGPAVLVFLALVFARATQARVALTDSWAAWRTGRWIDEHRHLPEREPFSLSADPRVRPEAAGWLGQFVDHRVQARLGLEGLTAAHALLESVKAALLLAALWQASGSWGLALAGAALAAVLSGPFADTLRTRTLGETAFAALLFLMAPRVPTVAGAVGAAVVVGLWANLHATFPAGLLLLAGLALGRFLEQVRARRGPVGALGDPGLRRLWLALGLAAAALLANPSGPGLYAALWRARDLPGLGADQWPTLIPADAWDFRLLVVSYLLVFVVLRVSPGRLTPGEAILLAGFGLAAAFDRRAVVWWMMLWPWVLAPHVRAWLDGIRPQARPSGARASRAAWPAWALAAGVVVVLVAVSPAGAWLRGSPWPRERRADPSAPVALAEAGAAAWQVPQRIFNSPYHWGDYLLDRLGEGGRVFAYGRPETFGPTTVRDMAGVAAAPDSPAARDVLDRSRITAVVAAERSAPELCDFLRRAHDRGDWRIVADTTGPEEAGGRGLAAVRVGDPFVLGLAGADAAPACVGGLGLAPPVSLWGSLTHLPWTWPGGGAAARGAR